MDTQEERIAYMTQNLRDLEDMRHNFALKHGFAYTRPQNFKKCIVIRWPTSKKYIINYPRLNEYVKICHELSDDYDLWDQDHLLLSSDLRLIKAGIYCFTGSCNQIWAIPDENKEIQDYISSKLPKWAKLTRKL